MTEELDPYCLGALGLRRTPPCRFILLFSIGAAFFCNDLALRLVGVSVVSGKSSSEEGSGVGEVVVLVGVVEGLVLLGEIIEELVLLDEVIEELVLLGA